MFRNLHLLGKKLFSLPLKFEPLSTATNAEHFTIASFELQMQLLIKMTFKKFYQFFQWLALQGKVWRLSDCLRKTIGSNPFAKRSNRTNGTNGSAYL
jgi:hypothetical protein